MLTSIVERQIPNLRTVKSISVAEASELESMREEKAFRGQGLRVSFQSSGLLILYWPRI